MSNSDTNLEDMCDLLSAESEQTDILIDLSDLYKKYRLAPLPHQQVSNALQRIAASYGTPYHQWYGEFRKPKTKLYALVGPRNTLIATAEHDDLIFALRKLAWVLEDIASKLESPH
jgi:hypothetical protein